MSQLPALTDNSQPYPIQDLSLYQFDRGGLSCWQERVAGLGMGAGGQGKSRMGQAGDGRGKGKKGRGKGDKL